MVISWRIRGWDKKFIEHVLEFSIKLIIIGPINSDKYAHSYSFLIDQCPWKTKTEKLSARTAKNNEEIIFRKLFLTMLTVFFCSCSSVKKEFIQRYYFIDLFLFSFSRKLILGNEEINKTIYQSVKQSLIQFNSNEDTTFLFRTNLLRNEWGWKDTSPFSYSICHYLWNVVNLLRQLIFPFIAFNCYAKVLIKFESVIGRCY